MQRTHSASMKKYPERIIKHAEVKWWCWEDLYKNETKQNNGRNGAEARRRRPSIAKERWFKSPSLSLFGEQTACCEMENIFRVEVDPRKEATRWKGRTSISARLSRCALTFVNRFTYLDHGINQEKTDDDDDDDISSKRPNSQLLAIRCWGNSSASRKWRYHHSGATATITSQFAVVRLQSCHT